VRVLLLTAALLTAPPATAHARTRPLVLRVTIQVARCGGKPVRPPSWVEAHLAGAGKVLAPHGVTIAARRVSFAPERCRLDTRAHRDALAAQLDLTPGAGINVLVLEEVADLDLAGYKLMGVHWRYGGPDPRHQGRRFVILTARAKPPVLAHELAHYLGLPHDPAGGNLMTPGPSAPIWRRPGPRPAPFAPRLTEEQARKLRRAILALPVVLERASAGERVVDARKRCSDLGPGNLARPWCTLDAAGRLASPGDRVRILAGRYREPLRIRVSGTPGKPIRFEGEPGRTILDGSSLAQVEALVELDRRAWIVVGGLTLRATPGHGIRARAGSDLRFERNRIEGARAGAIRLERSSRVQVIDNRLRSSTRDADALDPGIALDACEDLVVAGNVLEGGAGIALTSGPIRGEVRDNEVRGARSAGVLLERARSVKVLRNRIHSGAVGIRLTVGDQEGTALRTASQNALFQNLVHGNRGSGIELRRSGGGVLRETRIYNNLLHGNLGAGIVVEGALSTTIANNILSGNGATIAGSSIRASTISHNLFHGNGRPLGTAAVAGVPRFLAAARGDFRLGAGSPAIDAGILMGLPYAGKAPDLGAHERR
jgi:parallel beta-helix repeat protein